MRWGPLSIRIAIVAVNLIIVAILIMSILPLVSGDLDIHVPEGSMNDPTYQDGVITVAFPLEVYNGGYFDIRDVLVLFAVSENGSLLLQSQTDPMLVEAGKVNYLNPILSIDMDDIDPQLLSALVFERTELELDIGVKASYSLGLAGVSLAIRQTMEWEPLIEELSISIDQAGGEMNGTNLEISVPYHVRTSSLIRGESIEMQATLSGSAGELGDWNEAMTIRSVNDGEIVFVLPPEKYSSLADPQDLTIKLDITCMGATLQQEHVYRWEGMA